MPREEKSLQTKILNDLRFLGKYCEATKIIRASDNGVLDVYFTTAYTGSAWIECKSLNGKAAKLQEVRVKKLNICGTRAFVCNNWDEWVDIKKTLGLDDMDMIKFCHERNEKLLSE